MSRELKQVVQHLGADHGVIRVSRSVYGLPAIFRACYRFTDRHYLYLRPDGPDDILVFIKPKTPPGDLDQVMGAFANDLIDQRLRLDISRETQGVRELIVAQAFAEGNLLPESQQGADTAADPAKILEHQ
jgi:His-Xaa-Ser system protein HxsD